MSEKEHGFVPQELKKPKKDLFNKTIDLRGTPETAIQSATDMESFIGRVGAMREILLDTGEIKKGWQIARMIENLGRWDTTMSVNDLPSALGIREKFLQLKSDGV